MSNSFTNSARLERAKETKKYEELTRCQDCAYAMDRKHHRCFCRMFGTTVYEDFFCGFGEEQKTIGEKERVREKEL